MNHFINSDIFDELRNTADDIVKKIMSGISPQF